jgi:hypothetical protein
MAHVDRLKEEIGWLTLPLGALAAIDATVVGWLAQNYSKAERLVILAAILAAVVISIGVARVNRIAYRLIKALEDV